MRNDEQMHFLLKFDPFYMKYKQHSLFGAILDAILNFSMKNPDPDLAPGPESLPIVSSST